MNTNIFRDQNNCQLFYIMKQPKLHLSLLLGAALLAAASMPSARAADNNTPTQLTYQGFLTDGNGAPLGNTSPVNKTVIFRIFDTATAGNIIWSSQQIVTVDKGYFNVLLGEGSQVGSEPFNADLSGVFTGTLVSDRYLELTVDGAALAPRLRFLPAPYSLLARKAMSVDPNFTLVPGNVPQLDASKITTGALGTDRIPNLDAGKITTGALGTDRIPNLDAGKITTGALGTDRIPSLDAGKITTGTLNEARVPRTLPGDLRVGGGITSPKWKISNVYPYQRIDGGNSPVPLTSDTSTTKLRGDYTSSGGTLKITIILTTQDWPGNTIFSANVNIDSTQIGTLSTYNNGGALHKTVTGIFTYKPTAGAHNISVTVPSILPIPADFNDFGQIFVEEFPF